MEPCTQGMCVMVTKDKDLEFKFGLMAHVMKANGAIIKRMVKASFGTLMAIFTKVNGRMTKQTGTECTHIQMAQNTKETGRMTSKMGMALSIGQMAAITLAST